MSDVLVYARHYEGQINKNSLGAVSEGARLASELGGECHAIVVGDEAGLGGGVLARLARPGPRPPPGAGGEGHAIVVGARAARGDDVPAPLGPHGAAKVFRAEGPEG